MSQQRRRGPMGGHGMQPTEKAKDFKGSMKKLFGYMGRYKFRFILMFIFAVAGTAFNIAGPKILGKATTELFNGLVAKVNGTGGIDFSKIGMILLTVLSLYRGGNGIRTASGIYYDRHYPEDLLSHETGNFGKDQPYAHEIF